jgi:modulator of FtsH protease HflC
MSKNLFPVMVGLGALLILLMSSVFVVNQTQQALVLQFGEIKRVVTTPGLAFKLPFVQNVMRFDNRLLDFEAPPAEFITRNRTADVEERVVIDAFMRYRITNPVQFYQSVKNEEILKSRLSSIVTSGMRRTLANYSLSDLLSDNRPKIMGEIRDLVNHQAQSGKVESEDGSDSQGFGIEVVDVRIMRADLPQDISQSTYERMRKNFTKEAQRFRAEGEEKAIEIRSGAERERTELLADAKRKSETIRGEGDGEAAKIYAQSFGRDPEFFGFYRSMRAYRETLDKGDTTMILSPDSGFLKELNR